MKKNKNLIYFIIIISLVFVSIYILNHYTVYSSDDYSFLYKYQGTDLKPGIKPIESLKDIFDSMKYLHGHVNGRVVPHFILQCILVFPKVIFNIINSFMFLLLGLTIYKLFEKENIIKNFKPWLLILIYSLMYLFIPSFGMTVLWCSGSLNYTWSILVILIYFLYLNKLLKKKEPKIYDFILIFVLSLISSNTVENFSISVLFFTIFEILIFSIKNKKFKIWYIIPFVGIIIGFLILFTGASNGTRQIVDNFFSIKHIYEKTKYLIEFFGNKIYIILGSFILMGITYFKNYKSDKNIMVYYLTGMFSILPLYAVFSVVERMFFMVYISIIIAIIFFIKNFFKKEYMKYIIVALFLISTTYMYFTVCYKDVKKSYDRFIKIESIILENKEKGVLNIEIPDYYYEYSKYTVFNNKYTYVRSYPKFWMNHWIAYYYGVDSVIVNEKLEKIK